MDERQGRRARLEHGRAARDPPRPPPATRSRPWSRSARRRSGCCSRTCGGWRTGKPPPRGQLPRRRCGSTPPALVAWLERARGRRRGRAARLEAAAADPREGRRGGARTSTRRSSTSAPPSRSGCCCSRAATTAPPSTTPSCRASRCAGSRAVMRWTRCYDRRRPARRPLAASAIQAAPIDHQPRLSICGAVRPATDLVVAAHELDQEALEPRQHQIEREQDARLRTGRAGSTGPRRRAPSRATRRPASGARASVGRHGAVGVGHRPGQVRRLAVVAVAGELAADPADRVPERERRGARGRAARAPRKPRQPGPGADRERAADRAAVPDQARARRRGCRRSRRLTSSQFWTR